MLFNCIFHIIIPQNCQSKITYFFTFCQDSSKWLIYYHSCHLIMNYSDLVLIVYPIRIILAKFWSCSIFGKNKNCFVWIKLQSRWFVIWSPEWNSFQYIVDIVSNRYYSHLVGFCQLIWENMDLFPIISVYSILQSGIILLYHF